MIESVAFTLAAGAANVVGALAVTARRQWSRSAIEALIALSAGFMIAVTLVDIVPHSLEHGGAGAPLIILAGYLAVHLTQHTLAEHFHFGEETHQVSKVVGQSALAGLLLHTFVDGVAITSGFMESQALGILLFLAIVLHKFPEGLAVTSLCLAAGFGRGRALMAAGVLGLATVLGGLLTHVSAGLASIGLPLSGGVALYVAASNLVPEFQTKKGWRLPVYFFSGCALFFLSRLLLS